MNNMTVSISNDPNKKYRDADEDASVNTKMKNGIWMIGVFDGHGGRAVSHDLSKTLPTEFGNLPSSLNTYKMSIIKQKISSIDKRYLDRRYASQGSTASFILFNPKQPQSIISVNLGDSRTILYDQGGNELFTTHDHKPNTSYESERIRKLGSFITKEKLPDGSLVHRVGGNLSVSRSFGDWYMGHNNSKGKLISNLPTVHRVSLKQVKYIVIVCDGVTDVLSNADIGAILRRKGTAKTIVQTAKQSGSTDNISAILIQIN